jgi:hypothetical protein
MAKEGVVLEVYCKTAERAERHSGGGVRMTWIHVANRIYGAGDVVGSLRPRLIPSRMRTVPGSKLERQDRWVQHLEVRRARARV